MSIEFTPPTTIDEGTKGLCESVAELRRQCAELDLYDPFNTEGRKQLAERALFLESVASALNIGPSDELALDLALRCEDYRERIWPGYDREYLLDINENDPDIDKIINEID